MNLKRLAVDGAIILMSDAHKPGPALGAPNTASLGSSDKKASANSLATTASSAPSQPPASPPPFAAFFAASSLPCTRCARFDGYQMRGVRVDGELPRGVLQREADLIEHSAQLLQREDPQGVGRDGDDSFGALLGAEARREFQALVGQRGQVEAVLVVSSSTRTYCSSRAPPDSLASLS